MRFRTETPLALALSPLHLHPRLHLVWKLSIVIWTIRFWCWIITLESFFSLKILSLVVVTQIPQKYLQAINVEPAKNIKIYTRFTSPSQHRAPTCYWTIIGSVEHQYLPQQQLCCDWHSYAFSFWQSPITNEFKPMGFPLITWISWNIRGQKLNWHKAERAQFLRVSHEINN